MVQINISDSKIEKIRVKMKTDHMYKDIGLRYDSEVINCLCDIYLQQDRDKALIKSTILELIADEILQGVPG